MTTQNIKIKAAQFTTKTGKDPQLRDLVSKVINAAGIDPSGMKFRIKDAPTRPYIDKGTILVMSRDIGVYTFCRVLATTARRIELTISGEANSLDNDQLDTVIAAFWNDLEGAVFTALSIDEGNAWNKQVAAMTEAEEKAAALAAKKKAGRPSKIFAAAQKKILEQKDIVEKFAIGLQEKPEATFEWKIENLGLAINLKNRFERFVGIITDSESAKAARESGDVDVQLDYLGILADQLIIEMTQEVMGHRNWARDYGGGRKLSEECKAQAACEFASWLEGVRGYVDLWLERPERARLYGWTLIF